MDIQITATHSTEHTDSVELTIDGKRYYVGLCKILNRVNVLRANASHGAWRGAGRFFDTFDLALEGYKSTAAKAAIQMAREIIQGTDTNTAENTATPYPLLRSALSKYDGIQDELDAVVTEQELDAWILRRATQANLVRQAFGHEFPGQNHPDDVASLSVEPHTAEGRYLRGLVG